MIVNHVEIMSQMPEVLVGEEERVNCDSPKLDVTLEIEEDEPTEETWVTKGNKR